MNNIHFIGEGGAVKSGRDLTSEVRVKTSRLFVVFVV